LAFASIRQFFLREERRSVDAQDETVSDYLHQLADRIDVNPQKVRFVEFTVADSGIGIAFHFARRANFHIHSYESEVDILQQAFHMSERASKGSWIGIGLFKMLRAARDVNGLLTVRTGRIEASRHYLGEFAGDSLTVIPGEKPSASLGGTAVTLLMPWVDPEPALLPFAEA
jgi:hypothetical protein